MPEFKTCRYSKKVEKEISTAAQIYPSPPVIMTSFFEKYGYSKHTETCKYYHNSIIKYASAFHYPEPEFSIGFSVKYSPYSVQVKDSKEKKKQRIIGRFDTKEEAIIARLKAEKEYYGEFAPQRNLWKEYGIEDD